MSYLKLRDNPIWKWAVFKGMLCLFLVLFQIMPVKAATAVGYVDYVDVVNGTSSNFKWIRDGKLAKVLLHRAVYNGDTITVLNSNVKVRLLLGSDKEPVTLTYFDGKKPYRVDVAPCKWWCSIRSWVEDNLINDPPPKRLSAISKGEEIEVDVLKEGSAQNNQLEAGKKEVHFAWVGGKAPYSIIFKHIRSNNKKTWHCSGDEICSSITTGDTKEDRLFRIAVPQQQGGFKFESGKSYYITINDDNGASTNRRFMVVPKSGKHRSFEDLAKKSEWQFEAYQQTFSKKGGIAEMIRMGFEAGSWP